MASILSSIRAYPYSISFSEYFLEFNRSDPELVGHHNEFILPCSYQYRHFASSYIEMLKSMIDGNLKHEVFNGAGHLPDAINVFEYLQGS